MKITNQLWYVRSIIKNYSQEYLSKVSGISRHAISEIELSKRIPKLETALLLARALDCRVEDIFTLNE